jgi:hypothetical protein
VTWDVHLLEFPERFSRAEAIAWASLHGFDHDVVDSTGRRVVVEPLPVRAFAPSSLRWETFRPSGVNAIVGLLGRRESRRASEDLSYLKTDADRRRYERYSRLLRRRTAEGRSRVKLTGRSPTKNADLASWYGRWFRPTHPAATREDLAVGRAIMRGLGEASREHALEYVRKLGFRGSADPRIRGRAD